MLNPTMGALREEDHKVLEKIIYCKKGNKKIQIVMKDCNS